MEQEEQSKAGAQSMNSADICHEVFPGLYVDAFSGKFLQKTHDASNCFILTHYHGDHYKSLPRDGRYQGPAVIHCSRVTAELLKEVHEIPPQLIQSHDYNETFEYKEAKITFFDANHCPGACLVLVQLANGNAHLHTGDMRYCETFKSYPLLREMVTKKKVDLVYLDTTYGHPKHDFVPQEQAVECIASQTKELLSSHLNVLVLLSCYSIGKEKVLWEASARNNQKLYVSERKLRMLRCIQLKESSPNNISSQVIHRCTEDPSQSDIHVIPMGLAGEMWPYFRPNYIKCRDYVEKLHEDNKSKTYDKVVAFLPTGWANASKWNKKNAISKKSFILQNGKTLDVEIRLISYSEHSSFQELIDFVQYLRPRKVIPTVFSDEGDFRRIQDRFRHLIDSTRAKKAFFQSMEKAAGRPSKKIKMDEKETPKIEKTDSNDSDIEVVKVITPSPKASISDDQTSRLVDMGFSLSSAQEALKKCKGNLDMALESLLTAVTIPPPERKKQKSSPHITSYFGKKT